MEYKCCDIDDSKVQVFDVFKHYRDRMENVYRRFVGLDEKDVHQYRIVQEKNTLDDRVL